MKILILIATLCLASKASFSQQQVIDSLNVALEKEKTDTGKAIILYQLSSAYQVFKPDSALLLAQKAYSLSIKHKFLRGESWALNQMAGAFSRLGNQPHALEHYLMQLKIEEQRGYPDNMAAVLTDIALVYSTDKDFEKALFYALKADSIIKQNNLETHHLYNLLNIGDIYEKADKLPQALSYTLSCYQLAIKMNNGPIIGNSLNNLGNIYAKMGDTLKAINSYKESVSFLSLAYDNNTLSEGSLGLAKVYDRSGLPDSARFYAFKAYSLSMQHQLPNQALEASAFLSQWHKRQNMIDSAFAYQEITIGIKSSIASSEKAKQLQLLTIEEQLRQKEMFELKEKEKEERHQMLQLLAIGIAIPIFFLLSNYLGRRKVHLKVVKYSGIISILLLFEYITLLIHPVVAELTHHTPLIEIIIFIVIAAIITPTHHKIEKWLTARLTMMHEHHQKSRIEKVKASTDTPPLPDKNDV